MAGGMSAPSIAWLREQGLAVYDDAERCGRALAARAFLRRSADAAQSPELPSLPPPGPFADTLLESEAMELLAGADVPVPVTLLTTDAESAAAAADSIAGPVAVKAAARDLLHRSDAGAVVLGVASGAEAAAAHTRVVEAARAVGATPEGSVVQQMSPAGVELIVGARRDPEFGPVLVVGMGGVTAELQADVARRLLPLREGEALTMLQELRTFALLTGYRGAPAGDLAAAARAIDGIARLAVAFGDRLEAIEVNPLIVGADGAIAVDALIIPAATTSPLV
jgi:acyl-CoA synthetase (NDP forming)